MFAVESFMIGTAMLLMVAFCGLLAILGELVNLTPPFVQRYRAMKAYRESLEEFERAKARGEKKVLAFVNPEWTYAPQNVPIDDAIAGAKRGYEKASRLRYLIIPM